MEQQHPLLLYVVFISVNSVIQIADCFYIVGQNVTVKETPAAKKRKRESLQVTLLLLHVLYFSWI